MNWTAITIVSIICMTVVVLCAMNYKEERMKKKHYYNICPKCGAHLDPGERCDCEDESHG